MSEHHTCSDTCASETAAVSASVCRHDHLHDVNDFGVEAIDRRLQTAQQQCQQRGVRFTPLRQDIYRLILQAQHAIGAYELIHQLQLQRQSDAKAQTAKSTKQVAPPTVYRSLEFLLQQGLIHQLTTINAFVPCCHPRTSHVAAFLICEQCNRVQEYSGLPVREMVSHARDDIGFAVTRSVIEMMGRCGRCQDTLADGMS